MSAEQDYDPDAILGEFGDDGLFEEEDVELEDTSELDFGAVQTVSPEDILVPAEKEMLEDETIS